MIIVTKKDVTQDELGHIRERVESLGLCTHISRGEHRTIVGCLGDEERLQGIQLLSIPGVEAVHAVLTPYKLASRDFAAEPTRIALGDVEIGGDDLVVIAGPCSVEGREMLERTARAVVGEGARALRGGAFKPRSSPYSIRGLGEEGLELLSDVRSETGLPIVTEVMDTRHVDLVASYADMLQIGARNMQNFSLLTEVGRLRRPVLLKLGMSATVEDLLLAGEYVMRARATRTSYCASAGSEPSVPPHGTRSTSRRSRSSNARRICRCSPIRPTPAAAATSWHPSRTPRSPPGRTDSWWRCTRIRGPRRRTEISPSTSRS